MRSEDSTEPKAVSGISLSKHPSRELFFMLKVQCFDRLYLLPMKESPLCSMAFMSLKITFLLYFLQLRYYRYHITFSHSVIYLRDWSFSVDAAKRCTFILN